jgi:hypothetical protein
MVLADISGVSANKGTDEMTDVTPSRRQGPRPWFGAAVGALVLTCSLCSRRPRVQYEVYPGMQLRDDAGFRSSACRDSVEIMLSEIWNSSFWQRNDRLREEILNNDYGIFECRDRTDKEFRARAFYRKTDDRQQVMLNKRLFRHFAVKPEGGIALTDLDRGIKATMVHELLHDVWFNVLDGSLKAQFTADAEFFLAELSLARTKQDKLDILLCAGYIDPSPSEFEPFAELLCLGDIYDDQTLNGTELFAILGDRAYSGRILIPRPFRKYYYGILSHSALNRTRR